MSPAPVPSGVVAAARAAAHIAGHGNLPQNLTDEIADEVLAAVLEPVREQECGLLTEAEDALHSIALRLLAVSPKLKEPYTDAPDLSPWSMSIGPQARRAHDLAQAIRKHLGLPFRSATRALGTPPLEVERVIAEAVAAERERWLQATPCPTPCDEDCELRPDGCHESHAVPSKRAHDPVRCGELRLAIARAVAAERERLFTAIRHAIPLEVPWRGEALDLIAAAWADLLAGDQP